MGRVGEPPGGGRGVSAPRALGTVSLAAATAALAARDARLARLVERNGIPPLWGRAPGFRTLARIILEQQVSLASARTLFRRIDRSIPGGIDASSVGRTGITGLRDLGLTRQKASYVHGLAVAVEDGTLPLASLGGLDDGAVLDLLTRTRGIGPWSAGVYLLMALKRPDVWPPGDLALHVALARLRRLDAPPSSEDAARYASRWSPWRSVAARILWHGYLADRRAGRTT